MSKEIIYTPYARECLKQILLYISADSYDRAYEFIDKIIIEIKKLEKFPKLGTQIEHNRRKILINKNYKVIYRVDENNIYILYVANVKLKK